jgi:hypothetical protein
VVQVTFRDIFDLFVGSEYHFKTFRSGHRFHVTFRDIGVQFTFRDIADWVAGFVYHIETCRSGNRFQVKFRDSAVQVIFRYEYIAGRVTFTDIAVQVTSRYIVDLVAGLVSFSPSHCSVVDSVHCGSAQWPLVAALFSLASIYSIAFDSYRPY